jgi:type II secretory pathway pseudopilin PulG
MRADLFDRERGETLIEVLIAFVILSIGVIGISSSITNSLAAAGRVHGRAEVSQLVTHAADEIQRTAWQCDPAAAVSSLYQSVLSPLLPSPSWTIEVTAISHWGKSRDFEAGCPPLVEDPGPPIVYMSDVFKTLKMNIVITAPSNRGAQSIELVKRP